VKLKIRRLWVCLFPICAMACAIVTLAISPSHAQGGNGSFDVFLNSTMSSGSAGLYFVDARTGLSNIAVTNGTHHTLLETGVLFQENETGAIKIAYPDGRIELYPAIQPPDPKAAVNWIVSTDRKRIAWSVSKMSGTSTLSDLYTALSDGSDKKLVLHTSSTKNLIVVPLLITNDGTSVFYSRQIGTPGIYQLFPVAGDAFQLDVASGRATQLPDQARCACAVAFSPDGRLFARLETTAGNGFGLRVWDLSIKVSTPIQPSQLPHTQAGYLILSHDGALAMYTSARGVPPAKGVPPERYALVLVDVVQREQRLMTEALPNNLRAVEFESDNSAVLVVGVDKDGTYKLSLKDKTLLAVSAYTYLGTITG
jgi:hypothetical protein